MSPDRPRARAISSCSCSPCSPAVPAAARRGRPADRAARRRPRGRCVESSRPLPGGGADHRRGEPRQRARIPERAAAALEAAFDRRRGSARTSRPGGGGELARLNRTAAERALRLLRGPVRRARRRRRLAVETDGAYDPTAGPLRAPVAEPRAGGEPEAIDDGRGAPARGLATCSCSTPGGPHGALPSAPGWSWRSTRSPRGASCERAAGRLRERGIARARLELGGERARPSRTTRPGRWTRSPVRASRGHPGRGVVMRLRVSNAAVATTDRRRRRTRGPRPAHRPPPPARARSRSSLARRRGPRARRGAAVLGRDDAPRIRAAPHATSACCGSSRRAGRAGVGLEPRRDRRPSPACAWSG